MNPVIKQILEKKRADLKSVIEDAEAEIRWAEAFLQTHQKRLQETREAAVAIEEELRK